MAIRKHKSKSGATSYYVYLKQDGSSHDLKVSLKDVHGLDVQARRAYWDACSLRVACRIPLQPNHSLAEYSQIAIPACLAAIFHPPRTASARPLCQSMHREVAQVPDVPDLRMPATRRAKRRPMTLSTRQPGKVGQLVPRRANAPSCFQRVSLMKWDKSAPRRKS